VKETISRRDCLVLALAAATAVLLTGTGPSFGAPPAAQQAPAAAPAWTPPDPATIPEGPLGDSIRLGRQIFNETPKYAAPYVGNQMSCTHCHVAGGTVAGGIPIVGVPGMFPTYREREKAVVTYEERIQQCFERSEYGHRLPSDSPEMAALVAYSQWLSKDQVTGQPFPGRGLIALPALTGDPERGARIYAAQCAFCHGAEGAGDPPAIPPLWGPGAYSDGAGMHNPVRMAAFVRHNMPQNNPGSLTPQQAHDVATYVASKPHPRFRPASGAR